MNAAVAEEEATPAPVDAEASSLHAEAVAAALEPRDAVRRSQASKASLPLLAPWTDFSTAL